MPDEYYISLYIDLLYRIIDFPPYMDGGVSNAVVQQFKDNLYATRESDTYNFTLNAFIVMFVSCKNGSERTTSFYNALYSSYNGEPHSHITYLENGIINTTIWTHSLKLVVIPVSESCINMSIQNHTGNVNIYTCTAIYEMLNCIISNLHYYVDQFRCLTPPRMILSHDIFAYHYSAMTLWAFICNTHNSFMSIVTSQLTNIELFMKIAFGNERITRVGDTILYDNSVGMYNMRVTCISEICYTLESYDGDKITGSCTSLYDILKIAAIGFQKNSQYV